VFPATEGELTVEKNLSRRSLLKGAFAGSAGIAASSLFATKQSVRAGPPLSPRAFIPGVAADGNVPPNLTLRQLAQNAGLELGAAPGAVSGVTANAAYQKFIASQFTTRITGVPWNAIRPSRDVFDFSPPNSWADWSMQLAADNAMRSHGYHLVWSSSLPNWLVNGNFGAGELNDILREHISTVAGRYKGRMNVWVVSNEHVARKLYVKTLAENFWYLKLGDDYVEKALWWAKEADPGATLIINEDMNDGSRVEITNGFYELAKGLKAKGAPLDGVGMQMHLMVSNPNANSEISLASVSALMDRYHQLGLKVFVTEFDVDLRNVAGTDADRFVVQAGIYRDMFEAALDSGACKSFSLFNPGDKYSWLVVDPNAAHGGPAQRAAPTPWDESLNQKPAYDAMVGVLLRHGGLG
jgi:endo-1,4-beta-xylanase